MVMLGLQPGRQQCRQLLDALQLPFHPTMPQVGQQPGIVICRLAVDDPVQVVDPRLGVGGIEDHNYSGSAGVNADTGML